ncbi:hypothetical protein AAOE16_16510 [Ekhidna sp. MALMAid0563]|uniref:hypothetical protein n=1 Tax=Ekhidna sp. MALMAid0563 TaxID=3143937 RepID=UPI0032DFFF5E
MDISIVIARVISIIYLSMGIGLAFSNSYYNEAFKKVVHDSTYLFLGGWIATVLGAVLVHYHNIWVNDWRTLVTIVCWIILIKGALLLAFPRLVKHFEGWFTPDGIQRYYLPIVTALGLIFGYYGFLL